MSEQILQSQCVFNNPIIYIIECINWIIKYLSLLKHGVAMKIVKKHSIICTERYNSLRCYSFAIHNSAQ